MTLDELRVALDAVVLAESVIGVERDGRRVAISAFEMSAQRFVSIEVLAGSAWDVDFASLLVPGRFPIGGLEQRGDYLFLRQALALDGLTPAAVEATVSWLETLVATTTMLPRLDVFAHHAS